MGVADLRFHVAVS